jgi:hypothetical protein
MTFRFEDTRPQIANEAILADLRRVAADIAAATVSQRVYRESGKYSTTVIKKRFGTWNAALAAAGLNIGFRHAVPDEELFNNLRDAWIALGRQPRKGEMAPPVSRLTHNPYVRRFGSWLGAMRAFVNAQEGTPAANVALAERRPATNARQASLRLRFAVMRRDGFKCTNCGRSPTTHPGTVLHLDHVTPFSRGGRTEHANLRTVCADCNLGKGDLVE